MFRLARYVALEWSLDTWRWNGLLARNDLLVKDPDDHGQYRYLADNQRGHFDRIVRASLNHLRPDDESSHGRDTCSLQTNYTQLWARRRYFEFQIWTGCSHNILQPHQLKIIFEWRAPIRRRLPFSIQGACVLTPYGLHSAGRFRWNVFS